MICAISVDRGRDDRARRASAPDEGMRGGERYARWRGTVWRTTILSIVPYFAVCRLHLPSFAVCLKIVNLRGGVGA